MGAADRIADIILRQGEIAGRGAQNTGAIWGGALQNLGQQITALPTYVQNQRMREQEVAMRGQEMQMRDQQMQQLQRAQASQDAANKVVAGFPRRADGTYDVGGMIQQMSGSGVHPADVEHYGRTFESLNQLSTAAVEAQRQHQARAADIILSGAQGKEITPEDVHVALATLKTLPGGLVTDDDEQAWTQAFAAGQDPRKFLESVSRAGKGPQKPITNTVEAGIAAGMTPQAVFDREKPPPTAPAPKVPNTRYEAFYSSIVKNPAAPTPDELKAVDAAVAAGEPPKATAEKSLQRATVMLDGKRKEVLIDPDPKAVNRVLDLDGKPITNAAQRISGLPTAAEQRPEAGTQPEIEIKPGTRMYRVAQDIAYGTLTMSDFNRIYGRAMGNAATKAAIYDTARLLNPDFSPAKFELDYKMAANPAIRQRIVAIDGLSPVIEKIKEISSKVGNGDVQAFNRLLQGAKLQVSNKTVANFQQLKTLLGDEVGLALGVGTGSDLKTKLGLDLVNTNLSDGSFQSNMDQLDSILGARKGLLLKQMGTYASVAGGNAPPTTPAAPAQAPQAPAGWKYVPKAGGGWTAVPAQ